MILCTQILVSMYTFHVHFFLILCTLFHDLVYTHLGPLIGCFGAITLEDDLRITQNHVHSEVPGSDWLKGRALGYQL